MRNVMGLVRRMKRVERDRFGRAVTVQPRSEPLVIHVQRARVPLPDSSDDDADTGEEVVFEREYARASIARYGGLPPGGGMQDVPSITRGAHEASEEFVERAKALSVKHYGGFGHVIVYDE